MEENDSQKKNHNHSLFEELSISYPTIWIWMTWGNNDNKKKKNNLEFSAQAKVWIFLSWSGDPFVKKKKYFWITVWFLMVDFLCLILPNYIEFG
jgi:hypothetical protein